MTTPTIDRFQEIRKLLCLEISEASNADVPDLERMDLCLYLLEKVADSVQVPPNEDEIEYAVEGNRMRQRMRRHGNGLRLAGVGRAGAYTGVNPVAAGAAESFDERMQRRAADIVTLAIDEISKRWHKPEARAMEFLDLYDRLKDIAPGAAEQALEKAVSLIESERKFSEDDIDAVFPDDVLGGPDGGAGIEPLPSRDGSPHDRGVGGAAQGPEEVPRAGA